MKQLFTTYRDKLLQNILDYAYLKITDRSLNAGRYIKSYIYSTPEGIKDDTI